jgi:hypothetical protein
VTLIVLRNGEILEWALSSAQRGELLEALSDQVDYWRGVSSDGSELFVYTEAVAAVQCSPPVEELRQTPLFGSLPATPP